jgi:phage shock protein C
MTETKKLTRPSDGRMLAGVCAGIARYLNVDPTVVRIAAVVLMIVTAVFPVAIGYVIGWMLMPEDDGTTAWGRVSDVS